MEGNESRRAPPKNAEMGCLRYFPITSQHAISKPPRTSAAVRWNGYHPVPMTRAIIRSGATGLSPTKLRDICSVIARMTAESGPMQTLTSPMPEIPASVWSSTSPTVYEERCPQTQPSGRTMGKLRKVRSMCSMRMMAPLPSLLSRDAPAPVDHDALACDVRGIFRGEEGNSRGDLRRVPKPFCDGLVGEVRYVFL